MPFIRPTLEAILHRIRGDFIGELGEAVLTRGSTEDILARALSKLSHGLHGHLSWAAEQILPNDCENEQVLRWARILRIPQIEAAKASGIVGFTTTGDTTIPVGAIARRDDGFEYVIVETELAGAPMGEELVLLEAVEPGADGNADPGTVVTLAVPLAGVTSAAAMDDGATGGRDLETVESLRQRVLHRFAHPDVIGGPGNYVEWALEVPGVAAAWERSQPDGAGTVDLHFMDHGATGYVIPGSERVTEVAAAIAARKPGPMTEQVLAPTEQTMDLTIAVTPDTTEVRASVEAELQAFLDREAEPGGEILLTHIDEAISAAPGEVDHSLTVPAADVPASSEDHIIRLGTITWA